MCKVNGTAIQRKVQKIRLRDVNWGFLTPRNIRRRFVLCIGCSHSCFDFVNGEIFGKNAVVSFFDFTEKKAVLIRTQFLEFFLKDQIGILFDEIHISELPNTRTTRGIVFVTFIWNFNASMSDPTRSKLSKNDRPVVLTKKRVGDRVVFEQ